MWLMEANLASVLTSDTIEGKLNGQVRGNLEVSGGTGAQEDFYCIELLICSYCPQFNLSASRAKVQPYPISEAAILDSTTKKQGLLPHIMVLSPAFPRNAWDVWLRLSIVLLHM